MNLVKLEIERIKYGENEGQFTGFIKFDNELGEVAISLTEKRCEDLFRVCADGIVETAKEAATELTCTVIEHQKKLSG